MTYTTNVDEEAQQNDASVNSVEQIDHVPVRSPMVRAVMCGPV